MSSQATVARRSFATVLRLQTLRVPCQFIPIVHRLPAASRRASFCITAAHPPLSSADRKAKRAEAQRLGKSIVTVQLGQRGVTQSFLEGLYAALAVRGYVKIRVGGCDMDLEEAVAAITSSADCVLIHKIGSTFIVFRDTSLPPPSGLATTTGDGNGDGAPRPLKEKRQSSRPEYLDNAPPEFTIIN